MEYFIDKLCETLTCCCRNAVVSYERIGMRAPNLNFLYSSIYTVEL